MGPGSLVLFPLAYFLREVFGLANAELAFGFVTFHLAHVINDPHFAVTYLLFYRNASSHLRRDGVPVAQRLRYLLAGYALPSVLLVWAFVGLYDRSAQTLGWMIQLMYLAVGWHYAKQAFGVLMVLSARRGVAFAPFERRLLLAHSYAAWAFAWANPATSAGLFEERGVVYWAPARAEQLELATGVFFGCSALALLFVLGRKWSRERRLTMPLIAYLVSIWLWTIFTSVDPVVRYAIPAFHSLQYGYFVWLIRRNEGYVRESQLGPPVATSLWMLFGSAVALGWFLFRGLPTVLDGWLVPNWHTSSEDLGATPFFAVFYVVVNLHHFAMDHVIWRRDHGETKWLVQDPSSHPDRRPFSDEVSAEEI